MNPAETTVHTLCMNARRAARGPWQFHREIKDMALRSWARALRENAPSILEANAQDVAEARGRGQSEALVDRLALDAKRVEAMAGSIEQVAALDDPVGEIIETRTRPNGLKVSRMRVPIGVIAMIYESRPNVTAEASALAVKAGNAIVLRGGSEAMRSNRAIERAIREASGKFVPEDVVQLVPLTDRDAVRALVQETELVDLAIPRGGEALIRFVTENARVPVVQHYKGVCHLFVDRGADVEQATRIAVNAKLSRPGVCNALECLLVDAADDARLLPPIAKALLAGGCQLRCDERALSLVPSGTRAEESDWGKEFLDAILAVRVVDGLKGALDHVARYGSGHTEAICTPNEEHAATWRLGVDAACVVVNASTRFHDGGELGLGAEIGIATSRLHWRGPMGLEALTTHKWIVEGSGQIR
jgi:glutamate-5-semialdehyde dehydrogenase